MPENIEEILKEYNKNTERHINVLKEDIDSKFDLVIERQDSHEKRFDSIDAKLDSHTETIGAIQVNLEIMKNDIEIIKTSLRKKVDLEDFEVLEKRVKILEAKIKQ